MNEDYVPASNPFHVDVQFTNEEILRAMDQFTREMTESPEFKAAVKPLTDAIDRDVMAFVAEEGSK